MACSKKLSLCPSELTDVVQFYQKKSFINNGNNNYNAIDDAKKVFVKIKTKNTQAFTINGMSIDPSITHVITARWNEALFGVNNTVQTTNNVYTDDYVKIIKTNEILIIKSMVNKDGQNTIAIIECIKSGDANIKQNFPSTPISLADL